MSNRKEIEMNEAVLIAYINDELSREDKTRVDRWLLSSTKNLKQFDDLKKTWEAADKLDPKPVAVDVNNAWEKVKAKANIKEAEVIQFNPNVFRRKMIVGIAAVMFVLVGVFSVLQFMDTTVEDVNWVSENKVLEDELSDGSVVTLNENSSLTYPSEFADNERRVSLSGEAFFDIERNEEKPFIIDLANDSYVKVLGTSFNIKSIPGDSLTEVFVKTGTVEFGSEKDEVILVAGEKGIMNNTTGEVMKLIDEHAEMKDMYWKTESLRFNELKLFEVVDLLNSIFEDQVSLDCEEARELEINSKHKKESLGEILEVIKEVHNNLIVNEEEDGSYSLNCK
jgi:ferric-dicitrate binding protein FerR (iron transport regulator)